MKNLRAERAAQQAIRRNYMIPRDVDIALGLVAVEREMPRSAVVAEALRIYLPTLSKLPPVQAISREPAA